MLANGCPRLSSPIARETSVSSARGVTGGEIFLGAQTGTRWSGNPARSRQRQGNQPVRRDVQPELTQTSRDLGAVMDCERASLRRGPLSCGTGGTLKRRRTTAPPGRVRAVGRRRLSLSNRLVGLLAIEVSGYGGRRSPNGSEGCLYRRGLAHRWPRCDGRTRWSDRARQTRNRRLVIAEPERP